MDSTCYDGICAKCWSAKFIVIGLILIANQLWIKWDIWVVIGSLLVLKGIIKFVKPMCGHCEPEKKMKKGKK